jgi:Ca2+/Na+ antiporter
MPVEIQPCRFIISPARSILVFDLGVAALILMVVLASPIVTVVKIITAALLIVYGLVAINSYTKTANSEIQYLPCIQHWLNNGQLVSLHRQQFVTRFLMVLYFFSKKGKITSHVIPRDAMPIE